MTTKVKAQKFRVRRTVRAPETVPDAEVVQRSEPPATPTPKAPLEGDKLFDNGAQDDGFGDVSYISDQNNAPAAGQVPPPARASRQTPRGAVAKTLAADVPTQETQSGEVTPADEMSIDAEIDAIRREGLTGRQLRMARRVAQKSGIAATSDFDAVRLLRKQGIDPFQRGTMLELVSTEGEQSRELTTQGQRLPKTIETAKLPAKDVLDRLVREDEISKIQQDIVRRRRRKMLLLATRLAVFVGLPTILSAIYFYTIASPMYATHSAFIIQQSEAPSANGLGGLLRGSPLGSQQDSIVVQDYLTSIDAMLRLDADVGFKEHFSSEAIDPIQRLPENPTNEQAYKVYKSHVSIGYDPTEGLLKMEVIAADPMMSQRYAEALIKYAEERVDQITQRLREDQMSGARDSLDEAEERMMQAQEKVVALQEQLGIISPEAETATIMNQIGGFETQLQEKRLQLQQLLDNSRPNAARVEGTRGDIRRLEDLIATLRGQLTEAQGTVGSLARVSAELRMAEVELQTRQLMTQQAVQALESARVEANRQVRYLSTSSRPVAPEEPTYPRKFENTLLALLVFSGIYLMASLTAAVLREQVSS